MTEEEGISRANISVDGALRLLLHCNLTDTEVQIYSLQVSKHKLLLCVFREGRQTAGNNINLMSRFNSEDATFLP